MENSASSRRAFLGAGAAGAGLAAFSALSLDRAMAETGGTSTADSAGSGTTDAASTAGLGIEALPPTIKGAITKALLFANATGFGSGAAGPLAWGSGAYNVSGGFLDVPLDLEVGATILRVDIYCRRSTAGTVSMRLNAASVSASSSGSELATITTSSGTGLLTGAFTTPTVVAAGDQYYLESNDFASSSTTFVGAIVTYYPAKPQLNLLNAPIRIYDSRPPFPPATGPKTPLADGATRTIDCKVGNAVPAGAKAALVTLTVTETSSGGFLALYKGGIGNPGNSSINWDHANEAIAVTTVVAVNSSAAITAFVPAGCSANLIIDVLGFYA